MGISQFHIPEQLWWLLRAFAWWHCCRLDGLVLGMCVFQKTKKKERRECKKKIKIYLNSMKILSFILPNPKCERSARTALWKGKCCGVDTEETISKFQQFYIRLRLQHGELGDTSLRGGPEKPGLHPSAAWAWAWGWRLCLGPSRTGSCFPLRASLCHHQGSLAWPEIPLHSPHCAKISERDLSLLLYHKTHL